MQAIVSINATQHKVAVGSSILVNRLAAKPGDVVEFPDVLLVSDGEKIEIGSPLVKNAKVVAEVVAHKRSPKILVFKKRSKKGYKKMRGHRSDLTELKIKEIKTK